MVKIERHFENLTKENLDLVAAIAYPKFNIVEGDDVGRRFIKDKAGNLLATIEFMASQCARGISLEQEDYFKEILISTNTKIYVNEVVTEENINTDTGLINPFKYNNASEIQLMGTSPEQFMEYAELLESHGYAVTISY
jgi:hypothetical protein